METEVKSGVWATYSWYGGIVMVSGWMKLFMSMLR